MQHCTSFIYYMVIYMEYSIATEDVKTHFMHYIITCIEYNEWEGQYSLLM